MKVPKKKSKGPTEEQYTGMKADFQSCWTTTNPGFVIPDLPGNPAFEVEGKRVAEYKDTPNTTDAGINVLIGYNRTPRHYIASLKEQPGPGGVCAAFASVKVSTVSNVSRTVTGGRAQAKRTYQVLELDFCSMPQSGLGGGGTHTYKRGDKITFIKYVLDTVAGLVREDSLPQMAVLAMIQVASIDNNVAVPNSATEQRYNFFRDTGFKSVYSPLQLIGKDMIGFTERELTSTERADKIEITSKKGGEFEEVTMTNMSKFGKVFPLNSGMVRMVYWGPPDNSWDPAQI